MQLGSNEWGFYLASVATGTRPVAAYGAPVVPAQNAFGAYVQLVAGAQLTEDVNKIVVCVNMVGIVTLSRDALVTIGVDLGAGYIDWISNLVCGPAGSYSGAASNGGPVWFTFYVRIPAGATIGAKASVNSSNLTAINVSVELYGGPSRPELVRPCGYIDTIGAATGSSSGTTVVAGTTAWGAWTEIGTLPRPMRRLEWGVGVTGAAINNNTGHVGIAIGSGATLREILPLGYFFTAANEAVGKASQHVKATAAAGEKIYARMQVGPNNANTYTFAAYAGGG